MARGALLLTDWLPAAAVLAAAAVVDAQAPPSPARTAAYVMVGVLGGVLLAARAGLGPVAGGAAWLVRATGLLVVAAEALAVAAYARTAPHPGSIDPVVPVVWSIMLSLHALTVIAATDTRFRGVAGPLGTGATCGVVAAVLWALLCLVAGDVPTSNAPAVLTLGLAAITAVQRVRHGGGSARHATLAGLAAAITVAFLSGVFVDGVLPHLSRWVPNNAPPVPAGPLGPHRLVDPVGLLVLSTLAAVVLLVALATQRTRRRAPAPEVAAAPVG